MTNLERDNESPSSVTHILVTVCSGAFMRPIRSIQLQNNYWQHLFGFGVFEILNNGL